MRYPEAAGFKEGTTSREAAESINAGTLRAQVLHYLSNHGPSTPDEVAAGVGLSVLAVRPRFTELKLLGQIRRTTTKRENCSGRNAWVWRIVR